MNAGIVSGTLLSLFFCLLIYALISVSGFDEDTKHSVLARILGSHRIPKSSSHRDRIILTSVSCGNDLQRDWAANLLRSMLVFADYDHHYTLLLFTDRRDWQPYFDEILQNFTHKEPKLEAQVQFIDVPETPSDNITDQFKRCAGYRITPGFYQRLLDRGYSKVIYADPDSMIWDNLAKLWSLWDSGFMSNKSFGLVPEELKKTGWYYGSLLNGRLKDEDIFGIAGVNSGVLLFDIATAIKQGFPEAAEDIISTKTLFLFDQDVLNMACKNPKYEVQCGLLPCKWNFRSYGFHSVCLSEVLDGIGIYHGTTLRIAKAKENLEAGDMRKYRAVPFALYWLVYPCYDREHCLSKMETHLRKLIPEHNWEEDTESVCDRYKDAKSFSFNGTEYEFPQEVLTHRHWTDLARIYCNQLDRVRETRQQLKFLTAG